MGLLHDLGKATEKFNAYILSETGIYTEGMLEYEKNARGTIDHSTAGAQFLHKEYRDLHCQDFFKAVSLQMIELCILSHHSGLIDCLKDNEDYFCKRIEKSNEKTSLDEATHRINNILIKEIIDCAEAGIESLSHLVESIAEGLKNYVEQGRLYYEKLCFRIGLLERFLLSCLIDADRTDSYLFENINKNESMFLNDGPNWNKLCERCESHISNKKIEYPIDNIRKSVSEQCLSASQRPPGVYTLTVPTGGGKTLSSLRFALFHAKKHSMNRIFFIVPYTTIIEQNAKEI